MRQLPPPCTPAKPLPSKMQAAASGSVRRRKACRQAARLDEGNAGTDDMPNSVDLHASLAYMAEAVTGQALGYVEVSAHAATEAVVPQGKARGAWFGYSKRATSNAALRQNSTVPSGCASKPAMCCCRTWQGNGHCRRPAPSLAGFDAATRRARLHQQNLMEGFALF